MNYQLKNPQNDHEQRRREDLERETAQLLAERRTLQTKYDYKNQSRPSLKQIYSESNAITPVAHYKTNNDHKTHEVINRLQQIIQLCKEEGALSNEEMREVVRVQNEVLSYLQKNISMDLKSQKDIKDTPKINGSKIQVNQTWGKQNTQDRINLPISEDTLEMIAEIQRKALTEIIHLQKERDSIKQQRDRLLSELNKYQSQPITRGNQQNERLRQEIRLLIQQNNALLYRVDTLSKRGDQGSIVPLRQEGLNGHQYDSQIVAYQNELKRAVNVINELKMRLSNVPGLEELHDQGQRIRRQTSELLQLRKGNDNYSLVRELQERLDEQERGKETFLDELKAFKNRYTQLEQENRALKKSKVSFDPVSRPVAYVSYTPERQSAPNRGIIKKKAGLADFESAIHEMRSALE